MNLSGIWEIIALLHEAKPSGIYPSNTWRVQLFPKLHENTGDYLLII